MSGPFCTVRVASITPIASDSLGWPYRALYFWRSALARCLNRISLHRWQTGGEIPLGWRRKSRRFTAELLVRPGNFYLRWQGAPVQVLSGRMWVERELALAAELGHDVRAVAGRAALDLRIIAGSALSEILQEDRPLDQKLLALRLAAQGLRRLHATAMTDGKTVDYALSHGDATCHNVIVNLDTSSATWIDFDTSHLAHIAAADRHADDVRTLLFSSATKLSVSDYGRCAESVFSGYGHDDVLRRVQGQVVDRRCPTVFHLAQSPLGCTAFDRLRQTVVGIPVGDATEISGS